MTENEAIKEFKERLAIEDYKKDIPEYYEAMRMAVSSLSEVQQYRALGMVEELREAMEKQRAKKPKFYAQNFYCSKCGNLVGNKEFGWQRFMYCDHCGQAIDWSEEE